MAVLLALPIYLLGLIPAMQPVKDPRKFLFAQEDFSRFHYAIIGDSVFCSYCVDSDSETMWAQFEKLTRYPCFPAALNGATIADMMDAAGYLSGKMPSGSTVFVGLIPTRFVGKGIVRHRNYFQEFDSLKIMERSSFTSVSLHDLSNFLFKGFLLYDEPYALEKFLRKRKGNYDTGYKVWYDLGREKALRKFNSFVSSQTDKEVYIDTVAIDNIRNTLAEREITAVFVLSGLNFELIKSFSNGINPEELIAKLNNAHTRLVDYFDSTGYEYIDLYNSIDSDCFVDLVHINTCGDAEMAQAFADFATQSSQKER